MKIISRVASLKLRYQLEKSLRAPELAQLKVLGHLQHTLKNTERLAPYAWTNSSNYADFIRKIPCVQYEDIAPSIHLQMNTSKKIIAPENPKFYERTSGSSGAVKYIPYTAGYLKILNRLFLLWVDDILHSPLRFHTAKTFLCVTPSLPPGPLHPSVAIGSTTDADYVARWWGPLLNQFLAVPMALHTVRDPKAYQDLLCLFLIAAADLEILSLWSPSLWFAMLDHVREHRQRLLVHLHSGTYSSAERRWTFAKISAPRAKILAVASPDWQMLWPQLTFISCWNQGHAKADARRLAKLFPSALLQGKGLLATEAPVSLPLLFAQTSVPFLTQVFIEGEDLLDRQVYPLWQMQLDHSYRVIVSLPNGILRYHLGDVVKVTGFYKKTPLFEFIGRDSQSMDMVGEKLSEDFLLSAVDQMAPAISGNWALFPVRAAGHSYYHMLVDTPQSQVLALALDAQLCTAHHYQLARNLGQLQPLAIEYCLHWTARYLALSTQKGQQLGNIKLAFLQRRIYSRTEIDFLRGRDL